MSALPVLADLGLAERSSAVLDSTHARRLAQTLDRPDHFLDDGHLPLTWIWVFFTPTVATAGLRTDGHPASAPDGPLAGRERRMFIGGSIERHGELRLDEQAGRTTRVVDATVKDGKAGSFLLVDIEHHVHQHGELVLVERQQVMYRAAPSAPVPAPGPDDVPPRTNGTLSTLTPDERLLFRYSALTFNTHRIHYDLPYATREEGYPGLVVHGPLTATLLADQAAADLGGPLRSFRFRATAPTFAGTSMAIVTEAADDGPSQRAARAIRADGVTVMTATAAI